MAFGYCQFFLINSLGVFYTENNNSAKKIKFGVKTNSYAYELIFTPNFIIFALFLCVDDKIQPATIRDEVIPRRPSKPTIVKNGHANNSPSPTLNVRPLNPVTPSHPTFEPTTTTTTTSRTKVTTTPDTKNVHKSAEHPVDNEIAGSVNIR